jgi:uncharacterized protein (DUF302 family)
VLVFGNARAGTRLMHADQGVGIELSLRMLVIRRPSGEAALIRIINDS